MAAENFTCFDWRLATGDATVCGCYTRTFVQLHLGVACGYVALCMAAGSIEHDTNELVLSLPPFLFFFFASLSFFALDTSVNSGQG